MAMYLAIYLHAERRFGRWKSIRRLKYARKQRPGPSSGPHQERRNSQTIAAGPQRRCSPDVRISRAQFSTDRPLNAWPSDARGLTDTNLGDQLPRKSSLLSALRSYQSRTHLLRSLRRSFAEGSSPRRQSQAQANVANERLPTHGLHRPSMGQALSDDDLRQKRGAVRRQLRMLFIYPICYFLIFLVPFISNLMNYSDYSAQHPVFGLSLASAGCIASIGLMDCLIFSLRERPWRQIRGSDGTISGSFMFWRHDPAGNTPSSASYRSTAYRGSRASHSRRSAGSRNYSSPGSPTVSARQRGSVSATSHSLNEEHELNLSGPMRGPWRQPEWVSSVRESKGESPRQQHFKEELQSVQEMGNWDFPHGEDPVHERVSHDMARDEIRQSHQSGELREREWFDRELSSAIGQGDGQA
ncbi:MAG: hypothetical protein M1828_003907 [Chrysothrix sp. TS-e1954]|nr:MAG: hypothetical protein M1828_003907 [Chrysothrix sp. TS-e1954]